MGKFNDMVFLMRLRRLDDHRHFQAPSTSFGQKTLYKNIKKAKIKAKYMKIYFTKYTVQCSKTAFLKD